jgi:hypothetical protein
VLLSEDIVLETADVVSEWLGRYTTLLRSVGDTALIFGSLGGSDSHAERDIVVVNWAAAFFGFPLNRSGAPFGEGKHSYSCNWTLRPNARREKTKEETCPRGRRAPRISHWHRQATGDGYRAVSRSLTLLTTTSFLSSTCMLSEQMI